jgi:hypothetical protein
MLNLPIDFGKSLSDSISYTAQLFLRGLGGNGVRQTMPDVPEEWLCFVAVILFTGQ